MKKLIVLLIRSNYFITLLFILVLSMRAHGNSNLMGWSNVQWGMTHNQLIDEIRTQLDYEKNDSPEFYEIKQIPSDVDMRHLEYVFNDIMDGRGFATKTSRNKSFPGIFQLFSIAVNPLNIYPPVSLVIIPPKNMSPEDDNSSISPKCYSFIFFENKLVGCMWTAFKISDDKLVWDAAIAKYGDPEDLFMLTEYNKNGGGESHYLFASYPSKGVCMQLSSQTYDSRLSPSELTIMQKFKNSDFEDYGKYQTIKVSNQNFNFEKAGEDVLFKFIYWDTSVVDRINKSSFHWKLQGLRESNKQEDVEQRVNDF